YLLFFVIRDLQGTVSVTGRRTQARASRRRSEQVYHVTSAIQTRCNDGVTAAIVARARRCGSSGTARPPVGGNLRDGSGALAPRPAPADRPSRQQPACRSRGGL